MADEKNRVPREPASGFVGRLVPDPASPPELTMLVGYPGASAEDGQVRLYASPDLSRWWEIPQNEVLHRQNVPNDPLGAEIVWIRRDKQPVLNSRRSDSDMTTFTLFCPTSHLVCLPSMGCPPHTGAQWAAAGPVQHQPHTIMGFNCPTGVHSQACTTTPVGAAALHPTFFGTCTIPPPTTGCTYGGAQGHFPPHTFITAAVPPHTQEAQAQPQQTWVWPTFGLNCGAGTTPVAQGAQAPQQTYVLPTAGHYPTIPPVTVCCYR